MRFVVMIGPDGGTRYSDSLLVFRAGELDDALARAVHLGREREQQYVNVDQEEVLWRLAEVLTLDYLGVAIEDGMEVYSEPVGLPPGVAIPWDTKFHPERSTPTPSV